MNKLEKILDVIGCLEEYKQEVIRGYRHKFDNYPEFTDINKYTYVVDFLDFKYNGDPVELLLSSFDWRKSRKGYEFWSTFAVLVKTIEDSKKQISK